MVLLCKEHKSMNWSKSIIVAAGKIGKSERKYNSTGGAVFLDIFSKQSLGFWKCLFNKFPSSIEYEPAYHQI